MYKVFWIGILLLYGNIQLIAQNLYLPQDFTLLMDKSFVNYEVDSLSYTSEHESELPILKEAYWVKVSKLGKELQPYPSYEVPVYRKLIKRGRQQIRKKKYEKARKYLFKALELDKNNIEVIKLIAVTYVKEEIFYTARSWLEKVIQLNYYDFEARFHLANCYVKDEDFQQEAINAITIAHLLNRNDQTILDTLKRIYQLNGLIYNDKWAFIPKYKMLSSGKDSVNIEYSGEPWLKYANCKAVWSYEPHYKQAKKNDFKAIDVMLIEEKECLLNLLIGFELLEKKERQLYPEIGELITALALNKEWEYIMYEIWATQNPKIIGQLSRDKIAKLSNYLVTIRSKPHKPLESTKNH